jgi:hypothetical protein
MTVSTEKFRTVAFHSEEPKGSKMVINDKIIQVYTNQFFQLS